MNCRRFQQPTGLTFSVDCLISADGTIAHATLNFTGALSQFTERELVCTELYTQARANKISTGKSFLTLLSYDSRLPAPTDPVRPSSWCEACDFDVHLAPNDLQYAWNWTFGEFRDSGAGTGFLDSKIYWASPYSPEDRNFYNPKVWFSSLFANANSNYCWRNNPYKNRCFVSWFPFEGEGTVIGPYFVYFQPETTRPQLGLSSIVDSYKTVNITTELTYA